MGGKSRARVHCESTGSAALRIQLPPAPSPSPFSGERGSRRANPCSSRPARPASRSRRGPPITQAKAPAIRRSEAAAAFSEGLSLSAVRWRSSSSIRGMFILTGQASRQAPHRLDAWGSILASFRPASTGDTTAPMGPG